MLSKCSLPQLDYLHNIPFDTPDGFQQLVTAIQMDWQQRQQQVTA